MKVFILLCLVACTLAAAHQRPNPSAIHKLTAQAKKEMAQVDLPAHQKQQIMAMMDNAEFMEELLSKHWDVVAPFADNQIAEPVEPVQEERCLLALLLAALIANALTTTTTAAPAPAPGR